MLLPLGTFGLISSCNVATRWIRHNLDTSVCFDGCDNISEISGTNATLSNKCNDVSPGQGLALVLLIEFTVSLCALHVNYRYVIFLLLSGFLLLSRLLLSQQVMD